MRKSLRFLTASTVGVLCTLSVSAQNVTLSGKVKNTASKENVPAVSITVKGAAQGAYTDDNGNFRITVNKLPVVLIVSSVGYESREVTVSTSGAPVEVDLNPAMMLGQEVVVAATRAPERILESPVTVERMGSMTLRNVPAPSYYEAINNLKGVDMHTASLTFRTVTTRGFVSSGNIRLNQLIDGMDNQAPGLNFSVGNIVGPSDLDVDNIELLAGASSALYGSGGINGTLLINSKSPFKYQGLSVQVKQGVMNLQNNVQSPSPFYDWAFRYGKAFKEKFAFKVSGQFVKANDWAAYDYDNVQRTSIVSKVVGGNRSSDPNYDGVNIYGDETSANLFDVTRGVEAAIRNGVLQGSGGLLDPAAVAQQFLAAFPTATPAQLNAFLSNPAIPANLRPTLAQYIPLFITNRNGASGNQFVSRTGYEERHLVDYNTINFRGTAGLFYKITPSIEASWNTYIGSGTTVYTGADRYSLKNLRMAQHKLEVRARNWFIRGYTTQENAGDSYNATVLGRIVNERWSPSATSWYPTYGVTYAVSRFNGLSDQQAHINARNNADINRPMPGSPEFERLKAAVAASPIGRDPQVNGARFLDRTDLWAGEGQLNVSNALGFSNTVEVIAGAQFKQYVLNSQGTLFADTTGNIKIAETGGYLQLKKRLFNDFLTLTAAGRYDKHTNFEGRFTPRVTAVLKVAKDNNIRLSYQTAYRFPTNQDQYINLNVGSGILIGGLPSFQTAYGLNNANTPGYTTESVVAARTANDPSLLRAYQYREMKPETVQSYEVGYKGVVGRKVFFDAYGYYSRYSNFLGRVAVVQSLTGQPAGALNPSATSSRNLSYVQNTDQNVNAYGWGLSTEWNMTRALTLYGNLFSDRLDNVPAETITFFNAPRYRFNLGLRSDNIWRGVGFNAVYRWQDENFYEGTFVTGTLPSFGTLDAQISYRMPNTKSVFRIGATNLTNNYFRTGYGSPFVGGLYYASFGYNIF